MGTQKFNITETRKKTKNLFPSTIETPLYNKTPVFSFKFYCHDHEKYSAKCFKNIKEFHRLFSTFKNMGSLKWKEIILDRDWHAHEITWTKTSEPSGFRNLPDEVKNFPPFQFKAFIEDCRIIGFFNRDNVFEIVWFDRYHNVYPFKD